MSETENFIRHLVDQNEISNNIPVFPETWIRTQFIAKKNLTLHGVELFKKIISFKSSDFDQDWMYGEGEEVLENQIIMNLSYPQSQSHLLKLALFYLEQMSAIFSIIKKTRQKISCPIEVKQSFKPHFHKDLKLTCETYKASYGFDNFKKRSLFLKDKELDYQTVEVTPETNISEVLKTKVSCICFCDFSYEALKQCLETNDISLKKELSLKLKDWNENFFKLKIDSVYFSDIADIYHYDWIQTKHKI